MAVFLIIFEFFDPRIWIFIFETSSLLQRETQKAPFPTFYRIFHVQFSEGPAGISIRPGEDGLCPDSCEKKNRPQSGNYVYMHLYCFYMLLCVFMCVYMFFNVFFQNFFPYDLGHHPSRILLGGKFVATVKFVATFKIFKEFGYLVATDESA